MIDLNSVTPPSILHEIQMTTQAVGFTLSSDLQTGALLRTLAATKPGGRFLELGTGTGMGTAWILDGMDSTSKLVTVESNENVMYVAERLLGADPRVTFRQMCGLNFLAMQEDGSYDFIFADTWPGKFHLLDKTLRLLKPGGLYIIDDLIPQPTWPDGHIPKVAKLIATLERIPALQITRLNWSTGIVIATRRCL